MRVSLSVVRNSSPMALVGQANEYSECNLIKVRATSSPVTLQAKSSMLQQWGEGQLGPFTRHDSQGAAELPAVHADSVQSQVRGRRICGSDAEPGHQAGPQAGEVTNPRLPALHDQLRLTALVSIHLLVLPATGLARFNRRTLPPLVQCNMGR